MSKPTRNSKGGNSSSRGDPRFQKLSRKKTKVKVGDRFAKMFTDQAFQDEVPTLPTDKYGIKRQEVKKRSHIDRIYEYEPDQKSEDEDLDVKVKENEADESVDESEEDGNVPFEWNEESSSSTDIEEEEVEEEEDEEEDIPDGDETKRFAVMNLDWDHLKAVDLFHLLRSFLPNDTDSAILKVAILPSLFGLERMEKENQQGPDGIWNDLDSSEEEEDKLGTLLPMTRKRMLKKDRDAFDQKKLRKYQRERLKYYFAVVDCSSKEAALHLYNTCNDLEIGHTSNRFDMRFIPDDLEFDEKQIPKDVATSAPIDHKIPEFHTKALQHTRVKLTWDQDDPERLNLTKRLRDDSIYSDNAFLPLAEERKLKRYLATSDSESSSEESSDEEGQVKKKA